MEEFPDQKTVGIDDVRHFLSKYEALYPQETASVVAMMEERAWKREAELPS